jgi:omega-amidase
VNRVGNDGNNIYHSGDSAILNFKGEMMNDSCPNEQCNETITLSKKELVDFRQQLPFIEGADEFRIL